MPKRPLSRALRNIDVALRSELLLLLLHDLHQLLLDLLLILAGLLRDRLDELIRVALALLKIPILEIREHLFQLRLDLLEVLLELLFRLLIDQKDPLSQTHPWPTPEASWETPAKCRDFSAVCRRPLPVVRCSDAARAANDVPLVARLYARAYALAGGSRRRRLGE
jgi:hypothetical protein